MEYEIDDHHLLELLSGEADGRYGAGIGKVFRRRVLQIQNAPDEREFYKFASWRFEKLSGDRSHQRSIRLNDQMRLIIEIAPGNPGNLVKLKGIEDYHK